MPTFYDILGVSEDASEQDIRKAYRALSLQLHPDRKTGDAEKYKEVNEAYETLSDSGLRQRYDMELKFGPSGRPGGNMFQQEVPIDINDIFSMFFGGGPGFPGQGFPGQGFPGQAFHFAGGPGIHVFHQGHQGPGQGNPFFMQQQQQQKPVAKTIEKTILISLETAYMGGSMPVEIERQVFHNGTQVFETSTLYIDVPRGIENGEKIILQGKGHMASDTVIGDVSVCVQIREDKTFYRTGMDLRYTHTISLKEALCGFVFELKHISGKTFHLNNLQNHTIVRPNYSKTIPGLGMVKDSANQTQTGNLIIEFCVNFPATLTPEQIEGLRNLL